MAAVTITSGTVATTVLVNAQTVSSAGQTLNSQSSRLAITTGIPDNDSFTVGAESLNIEGYDENNVSVQVTTLLADRFNNPVPDGTSVSFTTEGGSIGGSCLTEDGQCSVTFRSQNPKPSDGRVTILATATGEESFTDQNGDGRHQENEGFTKDLPEAYRDDNENGQRDDDEPFLDFNDDQQYTPGSGAFTGVLCDSGCDSSRPNTLNVRRNLVIVLSGSDLTISGPTAPIDLSDGTRDVTITILDAQGQVPPQNTRINATTDIGSIDEPSSYVQRSESRDPDTSPAVGRYTFRLRSGEEAGSGELSIVATTPGGTISRARFTVVQ